MTAAAPSGVVTLLFTDVEGSTRRWEDDADGMRAALAAHDEVLRTAIEAHGGFMFKHTGDGVCAAFASPTSAVNVAVAAQRKLELPVRMGLATGEAELRDGDYFGAVLNRAARVMAAGHGGQILVVESTASLLSGVDLVDLGPRRLRDLPNPIRVFQLQAPGLRTDFAALRTLDPTPGNLRPAVTSLVGRDDAVAEVAVIGVPDDQWGERVHAVICPKDGATISAHEVIEHCQLMIASYKVPKSVDVRTDPLPKSGAGKILKQDIRQHANNPAEPVVKGLPILGGYISRQGCVALGGRWYGAVF